MNKHTQPFPFIIWTLQRTGGTNLAKRFFEQSALLEEAKRKFAPSYDHWLGKIDTQWRLHEPFNMGSDRRIFGHITESWMERKNSAELHEGIEEICSLRLPMKHCVEMVPWEISATLAKVSLTHGYRHVFLYRKNAANRLLSLQFAKLSGVWGSHFIGSLEQKEKIFAQPLPVQELVAHEEECANRLTQACQYLQSLGDDPMAVCFEDIYEGGSLDLKRKTLLSLMRYLNLVSDDARARRLMLEIIRYGEQGTRNEYGNFKGIPELEKQLKSIRQPAFVSRGYPVAVRTVCESHPNVIHAALDRVPEAVHPAREFDVGGVMVVRDPLLTQGAIYAVGKSSERRAQWDIPSPGIRKQFSDKANSAKSRFKVRGIRCFPGEQLGFVLRYGNGESLPLFSGRSGQRAEKPMSRGSR